MVVPLDRWALLGLAAYKYHLVGAVAYGCVVFNNPSVRDSRLMGFGGARPDL